jgi:hypothetical protein
MAELDPQACMPCRGTGRVLSNLGDESKLLTCPWCQGTGTRQSGVDAQAAWLEAEAEAAASEPDASPPDAVA